MLSPGVHAIALGRSPVSAQLRYSSRSASLSPSVPAASCVRRQFALHSSLLMPAARPRLKRIALARLMSTKPAARPL